MYNHDGNRLQRNDKQDWTADKPVPVKGRHRTELKEEDLNFIIDIARPS